MGEGVDPAAPTKGVPTLLQARFQQTPRANCRRRPCDMHCTMSGRALTSRKRRSSKMLADVGGGPSVPPEPPLRPLTAEFLPWGQAARTSRRHALSDRLEAGDRH